MSVATSHDILVERLVAAPASDLYDALTRGPVLREWFCHGATVGKHPGERYIVWWGDGFLSAGAILEQTRNRHLAFSWKGTGDPAESRVDIRFVPEGKATRILVRHSGFGDGEQWAAARRRELRLWSEGLEALQSRLETGEDLREVRRPILGILVGDYSPEVAARLGIPGVAGVRMAGSSHEGTGAEQAGMRADDVIVEIAGQAVSGVAALMSALDDRTAGERVEVAFMRNGARQTASVALGRRPLMDVSDRAQVLQQVAEEYHDAYCAISDVLRFTPDEAARTAPAPGEWSALETVAHLVITERDLHLMIASLYAQDGRWSDGEEAGDAERIAALFSTYPAVPGMLSALRHAFAETQALLAQLPPDAPRHRAAWVRSARSVLTMRLHLEEHTEQVRAACTAQSARAASSPERLSRPMWRYSGL